MKKIFSLNLKPNRKIYRRIFLVWFFVLILAGLNVFSAQAQTQPQSWRIYRAADNQFRIERSGDKLVITPDGNVGIGTTAPAGMLHLQGGSGSIGLRLGLTSGQSAGSDSSPMIMWDSTNMGANRIYWMRQEGNIWRFKVSDTNWTNERLIMSADSNGRVGIGTMNTAPQAKLDVKTDYPPNSYGYGVLSRVAQDDTKAFAVHKGTTEKIVLYGSGFTLIRRQQENPALRIESGSPDWGYWLDVRPFSPQSGVIGYSFDIRNDTQFFYNTLVLRNGNVGIGTTAPRVRMHISGTPDTTGYGGAKGGILEISDTVATSTVNSFGGISFQSLPGDDFAIGKSNVGLNTYFQVRRQDGTELFTIDSNGRVGIGTTAPAGMLHLQGGSGSIGLRLGLTSGQSAGSDNSPMIMWDSTNMGANRIYWMRQEGNIWRFKVSDTNWTNERLIMSADSNGRVGIGTTAPGAKLDLKAGMVKVSDSSLSENSFNFFNGGPATGFQVGDDTDFGGIMLRNQGTDRKDTVIYWGDNPSNYLGPDDLIFMFAEWDGSSHILQETLRLTSKGTLKLRGQTPSYTSSYNFASQGFLGWYKLGGDNPTDCNEESERGQFKFLQSAGNSNAGYVDRLCNCRAASNYPSPGLKYYWVCW